MILQDIDSNTTWVEILKDKTSGEKILSRRRDLHRMKICGIVTKRKILDNEISQTLKDEIIESGMTYQLVPPHGHLQHIAEKDIHTWKDHLVAVLSGMAASFKLNLWCQIIPQAERTLLLLRR